MFSAIFEVLPNKGNRDDYLDNAKMLRPELEQVEGFDCIRYKSLTREGWTLSLSNWRGEKSLVRWRTRMRHHEVPQRGRDEIFADYHLRVGQITADNQCRRGTPSLSSGSTRLRLACPPPMPTRGQQMPVEGAPAAWMACVDRWFATSTLTPELRR
jgi:heme-degrading monooxygenase HmoA